MASLSHNDLKPAAAHLPRQSNVGIIQTAQQGMDDIIGMALVVGLTGFGVGITAAVTCKEWKG